MRVGIYVELAVEERPAGIGFHVRHIVRELPRLAPDIQFYLYYRNNLLSHRDVRELLPADANVTLRGVPFPQRWLDARPRLWWHYVLPAVMRRDRLDVFHGPNHFLPASGRPRQVLTVHDVAFLKMDLYPRGVTDMMRHWLEAALASADRVIAISENTRKDLVGLGVPGERIRVVPNGASILPDDRIQLQRIPELRRALRLPARYILFIGTIAARKNVPFLVEAFAHVKRRTNLPHGLVLAGRKGTAYSEVLAAIERAGVADDVIVTDYLDDWMLPLLYRMSDVFVLPSLYEGFTIVTLEAMGYGAPVIAVDNSSNRENVGDAGLLVDPDAVDGLADAMIRVISDDRLRADLVAKGRTRVQQFTWTQTARRTLDVYRELEPNSAQ